MNGDLEPFTARLVRFFGGATDSLGRSADESSKDLGTEESSSPEHTDAARSRRRTVALLTVIVLAGLALRLWGLTFGLPGTYRPDEEFLVGWSFGMIRGRFNFNPQIFIYPSVLYYLLAGVYSCCKWFVDVVQHGGPVGFLNFCAGYVYSPGHLIGRGLSAFFGTISILPMFALCRRFTGRIGGLTGASLLAGSYLHARDSHFITTDVPCCFFAVLALLAIFTLWERGRIRDAALAGMAVGVATGTKYPAVCLLIPIFVALAGRFFERPSAAALPTFAAFAAVALCAAAAAFVLTSPFLFLDLRNAEHVLQLDRSFVLHRQPDPEELAGWPWLFFALRYGVGTVFTGAALLGAAFGIVHTARERRLHWSMMLTSLFFIQVAMLLSSRMLFLRYALLPIVVLIPLAALAVTELLRLNRRRYTMGAIALVVLSLAHPVYRIVRTDQLLTAEDTRNLARRWIANHVPTGATVAVNDRRNYSRPMLEPERRYVSMAKIQPLPPPAAPPSMWALVTQHPLTRFTRPPTPADQESVDRYLHLEWSVSPFDAREGRDAVFDPADAFYVPLDGFDGVRLTGPAIAIYSRIP